MHITLTYQPSYCGWVGNPQLYPHVDLDTILGGSQWTTSEYPANWFNVGPIQTIASRMDGDRFVFDVEPITSGTATWRINVTSHYQYVIIDYELWYNNEILVYTFQDVYIGGTPDLLAINYQINKYRDPEHNTIVDRALISYDNLYGENKTVNVTIAYPETKTLLEMSHDDTEISSQYSNVVTKATDLGRTETLLDSTDGYTIRSYLVDIPENTKEAIYFKIPSAYGEFNDLRMWLTGSYAGGNGTSGNPYQISTWDHLSSINSNKTESFILIANLSSATAGYVGAGAGWSPLTNSHGDGFTGTFDGNGYTISDLFINRPTTDRQGLFGYVGAMGTSVILNDITLLDVNIKGDDYVGALAGRTWLGTITNCHSTGTIEGSKYVGGLVGNLYSTLSDSSSSVTVSGTYRVGGLVGYQYYKTISESFASGNVTNTGNYTGGLVGNAYKADIQNSYATGTITGTGHVGGLLGRAGGESITGSDLFRTYSTGNVTGNTDVGGLVGSEYVRSSSTASFWDNQTSNQTTSILGTGKYTVDMMKYSTFSGASWSIAKIEDWTTQTWKIIDTYSYPVLGWESIPNREPTIDTVSPTNDTYIESLQPTVSITVSDLDGDTLDITFATNESGVWTNEQTNSSVAPGTYTWSFTDADTNHTIYFWRVYADDGTTNVSRTYHFLVNTIPQLSSGSVDPVSGIESNTTFEFNVTISDADWTAGNTLNTYLIIGGTGSYNLSMSYVSGDNATGAYFNLSRTFPSAGIYTYRFLVYDGYVWNTTGTTGFTVGMDLSFDINFPVFLNVGQYIQSWGTIRNTTGPIEGIDVTTKILNSTYDIVPLSEMQFYVVNGMYFYSFSTSTMTPGIYYINVNYTSELAIEYLTNWTLYLSDFTGPGHHVTDVYFTFYDANTGVGIGAEYFKIWVDSTTPLTSSDRIYGNVYRNTYTGGTLYYRVLDYFDNQIYPTVGTYNAVSITDMNQFVDIPINWNSFSVKNMNSSIVHFNLTNGTISYSQYLFPGEAFYWNVLDGDYEITLTYYNAETSAFEVEETDTLSITNDAYYWVTGYNLEDIFLQGKELTNRSTVVFNFYNTNEGLGLDRETLKIYINGSRLIGNVYYTYNETNSINVTITDYYNETLFHQNFTITEPVHFYDLGLTFHSWLFGNKNEEYYMISLLKEGASRWWERGIVPGGEREFLIPSGNYTLRIYDPDWAELYNQSNITINNSRVYVIEGANLSEVLSGQSVIRGQLLELQRTLDRATRPKIEYNIYNPPHSYNLLKSEGAIIGGTELICPYQVLTATTRNESYTGGNETIIYPLVISDSDTDGVILYKKDVLHLYTNPSITWVNISYGTTTTNYTGSYPSSITLWGENVTINASHNLSFRRETTFQEQVEFFWTKYTETNRYTSTNDFSNPLDVQLYEAYLIIEYANDTNPDFKTTTVYDVTNGIMLTSGTNYLTSGAGVHMYLDSIAANESRSFTIQYFAETDVTPIGDASTIVLDYTIAFYQPEDKNYYMAEASWRNRRTEIFRGPLDIQFYFDTYPKIIAARSLIVIDETNDRELTRDEFTWTGSSVRISQSALGEVNPGSSRKFQVLWLFANEMDDEPSEDLSILRTTIFHPIQLFHIIVIFLGGLIVAAWMANPKKYKPFIFLIVLSIALLAVFYMAT